MSSESTLRSDHAAQARPDVYEGKAKRVQRLPNDLAEVYFKDDATAGNGKKRATFIGKGALCCRISELLLCHLQQAGIATHFISRSDDRTMIVRAVEIIPLEVVVRFRVAGSLAARTGLADGVACEPPICEFYYKRDDLGDPLLTDDHVRLLGVASEAELHTLRTLAQRAALCLRELFKRVGIALYDLKFEFGRLNGELILADEISPDTCRFRDIESGRVLDKDVFRKDLAELVPTYREVLVRLEHPALGLQSTSVGR